MASIMSRFRGRSFCPNGSDCDISECGKSVYKDVKFYSAIGIINEKKRRQKHGFACNVSLPVLVFIPDWLR